MLLKVGSIGDSVIKLQIALNIKPADGKFGTATESIVKDWQSKNGLKPDGLVGDATWSKLFTKVEPTNSTLNINRLKGYVPDSILRELPNVISKFNITNTLRLSHFLAQCSHESGNFTVVYENLNYRAERLLAIFKSDFDINKDRVLSDSEKRRATQIANNPQKIANFVYANQNGNGSESTGEGWKFRGRGYIQLTGKSNYIRFSNFMNIDFLKAPDLVASNYPLASAAFFFNSNSLWSICDQGSSEAIVKKVTLRVNGGVNGLSDRIEKFNKFYKILR